MWQLTWPNEVEVCADALDDRGAVADVQQLRRAIRLHSLDKQIVLLAQGSKKGPYTRFASMHCDS